MESAEVSTSIHEVRVKQRMHEASSPKVSLPYQLLYQDPQACTAIEGWGGEHWWRSTEACSNRKTDAECCSVFCAKCGKFSPRHDFRLSGSPPHTLNDVASAGDIS